MIQDAPSTLKALRDFFDSGLGAAVPPGLRSELRAARKLLHEAEQEFLGLPEHLPGECARLLALCAEAAALPGGADGAIGRSAAASATAVATRLSAAGCGVHELLAIHRELLELSAALLVQTQKRWRELRPDAAVKALLRGFYSALGEAADRRRRWQSVFPVS